MEGDRRAPFLVNCMSKEWDTNRHVFYHVFVEKHDQIYLYALTLSRLHI